MPRESEKFVATAARAYQDSRFERAYQPSRPGVRVHTTHQRQEGASTSALITAAAFAMVIAVVVAVFAAVHVVLDSASVTLSMESQKVASELVDARHEGSLLEVEVSALSNPTRIQEAANDLGMISPETATVIKLGEDVVVTNAQGDLSLAGSLRVVARNS